jgi:cytochrome P450
MFAPFDRIKYLQPTTTDIITMYCFGRSIGALQREDLGRKWGDLMGVGLKINPFARAFPFIARRLLLLPKWITGSSPLFKASTEFLDLANGLSRDAWDDAVAEKASGKAFTDDADTRTVLHSMMRSETLPESEKTFTRLSADGLTLIAGGFDTTSRTLAVLTYHILSKEHVYARILSELRTVIPSSDSELPSVSQLERLPYLTAVIHEGLRVTHPVAGRLARTAPDEDLLYSDHKRTHRIPRGVTFSQSGYLININEELYPNPWEFNPDRYLSEDGKITDAQRYMVPFGKGTRACAGIPLAWAELYLTIAAVFGSVSLKLAEGTTERDATIDKELFVGVLPEDGPGICVNVFGRL